MRKSNLEFVKEYFPILISIVVLLGISLIHIFTNDIWIDESSSLITTEVSLSKVIKHALTWEEQAPLYYFILAIWRLISTNYIFARFLSLIFMLISLVYIYLILKKYEHSKFLLTLFLLLISFNHNVIYSAVNTRYYSLTIFLSIVLVCMFIKHYLADNKPILKARIIFSIIATIAILTQYYLSFLLVAFGGVILFKKGFKPFFSYCIELILPLLIIVLQYIIILSQIDTYLDYNMQGSSVFGLLKFILVKIEDNVVAFHSFPDLKWLRYLIRFVYILILFAAVYNWKKIRREAFYLILLLVLAFIPISILFYVLGDDFVCFRHTMYLFFPIIFLLFIIIKPFKLKLKLAVLFFLIFMNIISEIHYMKKPTIIKELNNYLTFVEVENEPIFIYPNEQKHNLQYQYSGINELYGIPFNIDCSNGYKIKHWVIQDSEQLDSMFVNSLNKNVRKFYVLIEDHFTFLNIDFKYDSLVNYLDRNFIQEFDTTFSVYNLRKFSLPDIISN